MAFCSGCERTLPVIYVNGMKWSDFGLKNVTYLPKSADVAGYVSGNSSIWRLGQRYVGPSRAAADEGGRLEMANRNEVAVSK